MASSSNEKHAEDLRGACAWFEAQKVSVSRVEELLRRVRETADKLAAPTVLVPRRRRGPSRSLTADDFPLTGGHSVKAGKAS